MLILISTFIVTVSCNNESEDLYSSVSQDSELILMAQNNDGFTDSQKDLFNRLESINDSISLIDANEISTNGTRGYSVLSWGRIARMDAQGLYDGFRYGWAHGGGFLGKFFTATLNATAFSVQYSFSELLSQLNSLVWRPSGKLSLNDVLLSMGLVMESQQLDEYVDNFIKSNPDIIDIYSYDEIKLACLHNVVLNTIETGRILPQGLLDNILSEDQKTYFELYQTIRCYNAIPQIVDGTSSIDLYCPDSFPAVTSVMKLYVDGITRLTSNDVTTLHKRIGSLCKEYVKEVRETNDIEEIAQSHLISSFYLALLSLEHWAEIYN